MTNLKAQQKQELIALIIYKGKQEAVRRYMRYTSKGLNEAQKAIDKIAEEIEPGQA